MVLVTVLVMTGVCAIVLGGVLGYVAHATRTTAMHLGNSVCRLAAQSEIELAKSAVNDAFNRANSGARRIVGGSVGNSVCAFDWFGVGDSSPNPATRSIGAQNGQGTAVTLDDKSTNCNCIVRVRVGRIRHPADAQWAEVTFVAEASRDNPGGTVSRQIVAETVRFALERSKVFNNAYFVNNYGWFQGSGCTANGDVRANGNMYLDSGCKINGQVYAACNRELNVRGEVTNYGKMDSYSTYKSTTYGTANATRPLSRDPLTGNTNAGGYDAPTSTASSETLRGRTHDNKKLTNLSNDELFDDPRSLKPSEMPYLGDLTSANSDYRQWIEDLRSADSSMCKITQGGNVLVDKYYDGVGPSGDASQADKGVLILEGTQSNPIVVKGPVVVESDVIIKGYVTGQGTIYSGRNVHIVGNIQYKNPPSWAGKSSGTDNKTKDMLGLMAKGNIVMGDYTDPNWISSIRTYLTTQPYVQQYDCDTTDANIGYPTTFGGSYEAVEKVPSSDTTAVSQISSTENPGGAQVVGADYQFGKVRMVDLAMPGGTKIASQSGYYNTYNASTHSIEQKYVYKGKSYVSCAQELRTTYDRKYYESVCYDSEISSRCSTITRIDAVLYNNHGIFGKLGQCSINGSLVCRNEGLQYSSKLYLNWDIRLYSGSSETVNNDQVGLAKASDNPPKTIDWRLLTPGVVDFGATEEGL